MLTISNVKQMIEDLERDLGISTDILAGAVGANPRTVERWRADVSFPQREGRERLTKLLTVRTRLYATFATPEAVRDWMRARNRYLGGLTPADAARVGRIDSIENALEALDSGVFV